MRTSACLSLSGYTGYGEHSPGTNRRQPLGLPNTMCLALPKIKNSVDWHLKGGDNRGICDESIPIAQFPNVKPFGFSRITTLEECCLGRLRDDDIAWYKLVCGGM